MIAIQGQMNIFDLLQEQPRVDITHLMNPAADAGNFFDPGTPEALENALEAFRADHKSRGFKWKAYVGWHTYHESSGNGSAHHSAMYHSGLHCHHYVEDWCSCVKWYITRMYCDGCKWWSSIHVSANDAVHEFLDHCWPGWRDLPVMEGKRVGYETKFEFPDDYPKDFMVTGAPMLDCRGNSRTATRDIPGANKFGGYRVAITQDCQIHNQKGEK